MATTTRGTAILKFGTYTVATHIVNEGEISLSGQKVVIDDESGQNVTHISNFGLEGTISVTLIPLAAAALPAIDSSITYNGQAGVVVSSSKTTSKRQPETWKLTIDFIPGITY